MPRSPPARPGRAWSRSWQFVGTALALGWLAGILVQVIRLAWGYRVLGSFRRCLEEVSEPRVTALARQAAAAVGMHDAPRVFRSPFAPAPFCLGLVKPIVVVPEADPQGTGRRSTAGHPDSRGGASCSARHVGEPGAADRGGPILVERAGLPPSRSDCRPPRRYLRQLRLPSSAGNNAICPDAGRACRPRDDSTPSAGDVGHFGAGRSDGTYHSTFEQGTKHGDANESRIEGARLDMDGRGSLGNRLGRRPAGGAFAPAGDGAAKAAEGAASASTVDKPAGQPLKSETRHPSKRCIGGWQANSVSMALADGKRKNVFRLGGPAERGCYRQDVHVANGHQYLGRHVVHPGRGARPVRHRREIAGRRDVGHLQVGRRPLEDVPQRRFAGTAEGHRPASRAGWCWYLERYEAVPLWIINADGTNAAPVLLVARTPIAVRLPGRRTAPRWPLTRMSPVVRRGVS